MNLTEAEVRLRNTRQTHQDTSHETEITRVPISQQINS